MARTNRVETCAFCEEVPCNCNTPKRTRYPLRGRERAENTLLDPFAAPEEVAEARDQLSRWNRHINPDQQAMDDAIAALSPLLHPTELEKYRLHRPANPAQQRAAEWRARHGMG